MIRQRRGSFTTKGTVVDKQYKKVKNTKEYMKLDASDIKSLINNGIRVRSYMVHVLPQ